LAGAGVAVAAAPQATTASINNRLRTIGIHPILGKR